jgi:transglutaminase-like putative cysteine protease
MENSPTRWWDWPAAGFLLAIIFTAAGRLGVTKWAQHLDYVQTLAVLGVLLGLALGKSLFNRRKTTLLALGYSLTVIPLQLSMALTGRLSLGQRLLSLLARILIALGDYSRGQPIFDSLFFITLLSCLYWVVGLVAGYWLVRRGSFLLSALPSGLALLVVQNYDPSVRRAWFLALYLFLTLMLLGRLNYLHNRSDWKRRRVFLSPEVSYDLSNGALIAAATIVLAAWLLPAAISNVSTVSKDWERISQPWQHLRQRLADAFASVAGTSATDFYGSQMSLGTGNPLGREVVFSVHLPSVESQPVRFYWRARVYDYYQDDRWSSTAGYTEDFSPRDPNLPVPEALRGNVISMTFTTGTKLSTLYTVSQPLWVGRAAKVLFTPIPGGDIDVVNIQAARTLLEGESYLARSAVINPTIVQLQAAGQNYPNWVVQRYLQLPDDFSPSIRQLAMDVTQGAATPYDQAAAITDYLRGYIEYSATIPSPPLGRDALEWVLFDYKRGFCNYYASAEVLMLRTLGVPARMAVGFAHGELDESGDNYIVRQRDAHAWPEVYFPDIGWVEFEPTGNQNALVRPAGLQQMPALGGLPSGNPAPNQGNRALNVPEEVNIPLGELAISAWQSVLRVAAILLAPALIAAAWLLNRRFDLAWRVPVALDTLVISRSLPRPRWLQNWLSHAEFSPTARAFNTINQSLRWLGESPPVHATPAQRAASLSQLLPQAEADIQALAAEHQTSLYSQRHGDPARARQASWSIFVYTLQALLVRCLTALRKRLSFHS